MAEENQSESGGTETPPKKKISPLALALAVQCLIILGATGVIAKFVLMSSKPDVSTKTLTERVIASVKDDDAQIQYLDMDEFVVNLADERSLQTKLSIEVSNGLVSDALKARMPVIRSKILKVIAEQKGADADQLQGKLLLKDSIRALLNDSLNEMKQDTHGGIVREVLFVNMILL